MTANTYVHAVERMQAEHATRIEGVMGEALAQAAVAGAPRKSKVSQSVPLDMKKPRNHGVFLVAPTGVEPVLPP